MCLATVQLLASGRPSGASDADDAPCATCTIEACSNVEVKHHAEERFRDPSVPSSARWGESLDVNDDEERCRDPSVPSSMRSGESLDVKTQVCHVLTNGVPCSFFVF